MPKVVQYQPDQVQSQVVRAPRAQSLPSQLFTNPLAEGALKAAQVGVEVKEQFDTTAAEDALVQFERDKNNLFFDPESGYFNSNGRNAFDGADSASKALDDLKKQYGKSLNENARRKFDTAADAHITRGRTDIQRHAAKGFKVWNITNQKAIAEKSLETGPLYWTNPERMNEQMFTGEMAVREQGKLEGVPEFAIEENVGTFRSSFARSVIETAMQSSSAEAEELLEKFQKSKYMDTQDINAVNKALVAQKEKEKTKADSEYAVVTATSLIDKYETRSEAMDEINQIEDSERRRKTAAEYTTQYNRKKTAEKEQEAAYYQDAIEMVNSGMSPAQIEVANPDAWVGMSSIQRNNILAGKHMVTDQILLNSLIQMPKNELAKLNSVDYADRLKPSDLSKLTNAINTAKKGQSLSVVKSLSSKATAAAKGVFGEESGWRNKKGKLTPRGEKANAFLEELQEVISEEETRLGRKLSPTEQNEIIGDYTREITIQRSRLGLDFLAADTEINLTNTPASDVRLLNQVIDDTPGIDPTDLVDAYQFMIDNGVAVTLENLREVYKQGRQ